MTDITQTAPKRLVELLARRVRIMSDRQAAFEFFWDAASPIRVARTAIGRLERSGLVETQVVMAHPEITLKGPAIDWNDGEPDRTLATSPGSFNPDGTNRRYERRSFGLRRQPSGYTALWALPGVRDAGK